MARLLERLKLVKKVDVYNVTHTERNDLTSCCDTTGWELCSINAGAEEEDAAATAGYSMMVR